MKLMFFPVVTYKFSALFSKIVDRGKDQVTFFKLPGHQSDHLNDPAGGRGWIFTNNVQFFTLTL